MMKSTERNTNHEKIELAERLSRQFIQRRDVYARQLEDGRYVCVHRPFNSGLMYRHLQGDITLGTYLLDIESRARFMVLDADDEETFHRLDQMALDLDDQGVVSYREASRRGGHVWFFFPEPVPGEKAKGFGLGLLKAYQITAEVYPKQGRLAQGPGSLIRVPFGIHRKSKQRYPFIGLGNYRQQIETLSSPQTVSRETVEMYQYRKETRRRESRGEMFEDISLVEVVGQYVDLRPIASGFIGLCPFHEDEVPSFGINVSGNYWNCFAGCGGGDLISFWMKWKNCDFKTAIKDLEAMRNQPPIDNPPPSPLHHISEAGNQPLPGRRRPHKRF